MIAGRAVWAYRGLFVLLAGLALFVALLPFGTGEGRLPGPDLTFGLVCAWVLRRPDFVPLWTMVPVLLLGDVLLMRPLGLWTLVVLMTSEYLRRRVDHAEALPFGPEIGQVALCMAAAFGLDLLAQSLLLVESGADLTGQALHAAVTIAAYPVVVLATQGLGVRRLAPGEVDTMGARA